MKRIFWVTAFMLTFTIHLFGDLWNSLPSDSTSFLYIRDLQTFEKGMFQGNFFKIDPDYLDYALDFIADSNSYVKAYQRLQFFDSGNFIKTLKGEGLLINYGNSYLTAFTPGKSSYLSSFFLKMLESAKAKTPIYDYYAQVYQESILIAKDQRKLEQFTASAKLSDPAVAAVFATKPDLVYYFKGDKILLPVFDSFYSTSGTKKTICVGLNYQKGEIVMTVSPKSLTLNNPREKGLGLLVSGKPLFFFDRVVDLKKIFSALFGDGNLVKHGDKIAKAFSPQLSMAITSLSDSGEPCFLMALKTVKKENTEGLQVMKGFIKQLTGNEPAEQERGLYFDEGSGLYLAEMSGYIVLSDDEAAVKDALDAQNGRNTSVWDQPYNLKLKDLSAKPLAINVNFTALSESFLNITKANLDLSSSKKDDAEAYAAALNNLGMLVGYGEPRESFDYYFFVLKKQ